MEQDSRPESRSPRILIVDDHAAVRQAIAEAVSAAFPGCRCGMAACAEEALKLVLDDQPDIVLMDIELPDMNGILATLRVKALHPAVRVIVLSYHDGEAVGDLAARAGADAFVCKRNVTTQLVPALSRLLRTPPPS
jgi:DNA-binding NarL/FixJ family response regulator